MISIPYKKPSSSPDEGFLVANWGTYQYIYLWYPGVETMEETVVASRYIRLCYISAKFSPHPIVFPSSYAGEGKNGAVCDRPNE